VPAVAVLSSTSFAAGRRKWLTEGNAEAQMKPQDIVTGQRKEG
jgi:hypothetical protein